MDPTAATTATSVTATGRAGQATAVSGPSSGSRASSPRGRFPVPPRTPWAHRSSTAGRRRVRVPELALGLGLAAAGALASVLWATRAPSQRVLVAARALHRGEVVDASMVRWATVSGDRIVAIASTEMIRGRTVGVEVGAGAPLQPSMFERVDALGANEVEIGVALEPGDYPPAIAAGDSVSVVALAAVDPMAPTSAPLARRIAARVRAVASADTATGSKTVVSLAVVQPDVASVLTAARVRLAVLPPTPGNGV